MFFEGECYLWNVKNSAADWGLLCFLPDAPSAAAMYGNPVDVRAERRRQLYACLHPVSSDTWYPGNGYGIFCRTRITGKSDLYV